MVCCKTIIALAWMAIAAGVTEALPSTGYLSCRYRRQTYTQGQRVTGQTLTCICSNGKWISCVGNNGNGNYQNNNNSYLNNDQNNNQNNNNNNDGNQVDMEMEEEPEYFPPIGLNEQLDALRYKRSAGRQ
ncbi:hypothetical protein SARC_09543 [Sphaeroforma arctica JP610]|uniref:Sushi domain-containing protein n=1 Tax=Sphaeroforma arctica JP610 TaxID=667725 RepID=A0A0L0FMN0_9EUKA|nr:hypothetical protein SARC_09543 [Sphaeroforma arctica JP610]KNC78010.1 hypothetical protein SARC_09543 [Sphaeroforma arctica JP610]|eukprot:XP_014151912.1 hypothetical protein SARC_09543 [Sphaeroforma arctica JP610]